MKVILLSISQIYCTNLRNKKEWKDSSALYCERGKSWRNLGTRTQGK